MNKGDDVNPEYRSRLVAKEIKRDKRIDLFAATPSLEALKLLLSFAVTEGVGWERIKERVISWSLLTSSGHSSMPGRVGKCM